MTNADEFEQDEALTGAYFMTPAEENLLTWDAVPMVDLSIAFSPVLPNQHAKEPVEAIRTVGGKYLLRYGYGVNLRGERTDTMQAEVVEEERLREMRARFIIRCHYYALYFDCLPLVYYERDQLLHDYFNGQLYQPPEHLLKKMRRGWRRHLEAVKNAPPPDKNTVEGQLRELQMQLQDAARCAQSEHNEKPNGGAE